MAIVIVGAGIGGLTAALSLHAAGQANVRVLEAAPEIRDLGVGGRTCQAPTPALNERHTRLLWTGGQAASSPPAIRYADYEDRRVDGHVSSG